MLLQKILKNTKCVYQSTNKNFLEIIKNYQKNYKYGKNINKNWLDVNFQLKDHVIRTLYNYI